MKLLLDEMFSSTAAHHFRDDFGHDAVHVTEIGLGGVDDAVVGAIARAGRRVIVTENVADYAGEHDVVLACVLKRHLPSGGAQAHALATLVDGWAAANPRPYLGQHWPH